MLSDWVAWPTCQTPRPCFTTTFSRLATPLSGSSTGSANATRGCPHADNLLGVVKHCLNVEAGYFGPTFERELPWQEELVPIEAYEAGPQADWYT